MYICMNICMYVLYVVSCETKVGLGLGPLAKRTQSFGSVDMLDTGLGAYKDIKIYRYKHECHLETHLEADDQDITSSLVCGKCFSRGGR